MWEHPHDSTSLLLFSSPFFLTALLPLFSCQLLANEEILVH